MRHQQGVEGMLQSLAVKVDRFRHWSCTCGKGLPNVLRVGGQARARLHQATTHPRLGLGISVSWNADWCLQSLRSDVAGRT